MSVDKRFHLAFSLLLVSTVGVSLAQEGDVVEMAQNAEQAPEVGEVTPEDEAETTGGEMTEPFDVDAATAAYLARLSPEEKARSDAYMEGGYWLQLWGFLYTLGVLWLLLGSGLSARMRDLAIRITQRRPLQSVIFAVQYVAVTTLLFFPLTVYQGFIREHKYDLATQTFAQWMRDQAVGLGVGVVLLPILFIMLYGAFRRAPRTWWLWGAVVGLVFLVFVILIFPVYIAPLFNTYTSLEDESIRDPILSMARANGIETDDVYQFDASRQTTRISANVSGLLGTMRISLNDNLLNRCTLQEISLVMGHEMGHYVLNHVYESLIFFGIVLVGGFAFIRWSFDRVRTRWGEKWSISGIADLAGYPLLAALFTIYFFVLTPILNTYIRVNEVEADLFGLHASGEPEGMAEAAIKLAEYRKMDPGPIEEWIFHDHPSPKNRIRMAMTWKAEHQ